MPRLTNSCARCDRADAALDYITPQRCELAANGVKPLWLCVSVPLTAREGEKIAGTVRVADAETGETRDLGFELTVRGLPLTDGGTHDAWRLARLKWLNSDIARGEEPTRPYTDVEVDARTRRIAILGRALTLGEDGLPAAYESFFNASNTRVTDRARPCLASPVRFTTGHAARGSEFAFTRVNRGVAEWRAVTTYDDVVQTVNGSLAFDGLAMFRIELTARGGGEVTLADGAALTIPVRKENAVYAMGVGRAGGKFDGTLDWTWDPARKCQDAFWMGDVNCGLMVRLKGANYRRPMPVMQYRFRPLALPETWGSGGATVRTRGDVCELRAFSGAQTLTAEPSVYAFDLHLTPLKPVDFKKHFSDRYAQYTQRQGDALRADRADGATIVNLHHNTLWNPMINFPYNDFGEPHLRLFTAKAHNLGMRANVYYTMREITQNLPEFFPILGLDGEIFLSPKLDPDGYKRQTEDERAPHAWLGEHVGFDRVVPACRETVRFDEFPERMSLCVATVPSARFNNFYLEGLARLVREDGIDGLYIDDTSLDRDAFMRARRILDADGNPGRRIDLHSFNAFGTFQCGGSSALTYMDIFPYLDRLWFGEGFRYENQPDYWLVEVSGIPFGLTGEMLKKEVAGAEDGGNIHCAMLFGMTQRWRLCGDPRPQWAFFIRGRLAEAEFIGYWDPANPARVEADDAAHVFASVYRFADGRTVVAAANTSDAPVTARLRLADNANERWDAPAIDYFQRAFSYTPGEPLVIPARKGFIFTVE